MDKSWEKIVLAVSLVLLAAGAVALAFFFPTKAEMGAPGSAEVKGGTKVTKVDEKLIETFTQGWTKPPTWSAQSNLLFISDSYLYDRKDEKIIPAEKGTLIDGIPLQWLIENNLNIKSATVGLDDPDRDGFSNKLEYVTKTDPRDPASHPPFFDQLRLKAFDLIPFRLKFQSYNDLDGVKVFQINLLDVRVRPSRLVKIGDQLEGYVVTKFKQNVFKRVNPNTKIEEEVDESTLTIEKPDIGFSIDLILNKTIDSPESTARFVMMLPGKTDKELVVQRGKEFELAEEPGIKYVLLRADNNGARIRVVATKQEKDVPKVTSQDLSEVPSSSERKETK